jgi:hypothetical protein
MRSCLLTVFFLSSLLSFGQVFDVETIKSEGPDDNRINFVILPDGYQESELEKFRNDALFLTDRIFSNSFFQEYSDFINVHIVKVPSNESGASHPGNANDEPGNHPVKSVDNYFGSSFDVAGVHRLLVPLNGTRVYSVLADNFPNYDQIFVLVNSPFYGGSGGVFATASVGPNAVEVAIHEIGHSFAALGDEYDYPGSSPWEAPNTTQETQREQIRWNVWINEDTPIPTPETAQYDAVVGLFEGAAYNPTGWYRPKLNCKMQTLGQPFCEVCSEAFILQFYELQNPILEVTPEPSYTVSGEETLDFEADLIGYGSIKYEFTWKVNDEIQDIQGNKLSIEFTDTENLQNTIELMVRDTSGFVRKTEVEYTTQWVVNGFIKGQDYNPEITSFEPEVASAGETVTITGLNFNESAENVSVEIGETALDILSFEDNRITVSIPETSLIGAFKLTINGEEAISEEEFVTRPRITDFNPKSAEVGESILIEGTNFSAISEENLFSFGQTVVTPISSTATMAEVVIPEDAFSGRIKLEVNGIAVLSQEVFEVLVITGIPNASLQKSIQLYPNPSEGYIKLIIPSDFSSEEMEIGIFSLKGDRVLEIRKVKPG